MSKTVNIVLAGVAVAVGGSVFAGLFADVEGGLDYGSGCVLGIGVYLSAVVVICTGLILRKPEKRAQPDEPRGEEKPEA